MNKTLIGLRFLLLAAGVSAVIHWVPRVEANGSLTLPFLQPNIAVNSWFDHNSPGSGNNNNMIRYDGATWTDGSASLANCTITVNCYDGHNGIDFALSSGSAVEAAPFAETGNPGMDVGQCPIENGALPD